MERRYSEAETERAYGWDITDSGINQAYTSATL